MLKSIGKYLLVGNVGVPFEGLQFVCWKDDNGGGVVWVKGKIWVGFKTVTCTDSFLTSELSLTIVSMSITQAHKKKVSSCWTGDPAILIYFESPNTNLTFK